MKLIMCKEYIPFNQRKKIAEMVEGVYEPRGMDGLPLQVIKERIDINKNAKNEIFVTSDERFLLFCPTTFEFEDVYIYSNGKIKNIKDCTKRILRSGHNIFKLYISNEFDLDLEKRIISLEEK